ncbi:MAG TPA: hypothetical protein VIV35_10340 [Chitinophagaceae bacterium]
MVAKDILRIALFVLIALFAFRPWLRIRVRDSARVNRAGETEDTETQQLFQRLQDTRDNIHQELKVYENQAVGEEV